MIADTHLFPLPSSVAAVGFACHVGHLPLAHGSLQSPTATGVVDCSVASSPGMCQSQWSEMSLGLTRETRASVSYLENQHQAQPGILCGCSPDLELFPVSHSITNIPQSLPQMGTHSNSDAEQHDTWSRYIWGGTAETCPSSPHEHTAFSASGSLTGARALSSTYETGAFVPYPQYQVQPGTLCGWSPDLEPFPVPDSTPMHTLSNSDAEQYDACMRYFLGGTAETCSSSSHEHTAPANYDSTFNARADPQPSTSLTHNAMPSVQSTALPYGEPICVPDGQTRTFGCQWVTNGACCGVLVVADRRSVIKHLRAHDIRPGEDKARQTCLWESCTTTLNKESLARHILTVHLKEGVNCAECGLSFAREDSLKRHLKGGQHRVLPDKSAARQPVRSHVGSRRPEH